MNYVVGVDGGGSKTHALVLDRRGRALGFGSGGCGNHQVHGLGPAVAEVERAVRTAIEQSQILPEDIEIGCFCLSGADLKEDYRRLTPAMESLGVARQVMVKNDTLAALRAAITRSWGVAVICGSGFNAAARSPDAGEIVMPGLGFISGDWAGGGELSEEIIRMVMRARDGRGDKTLLTKKTLNCLGVASEEALLEQLYHGKISHRELFRLVPLLFEAADAGDVPARKLIIRLGQEVAITANALIKRLAMQNLDVEVGLAGGVFRGKGSLLIDTVAQDVHQFAPRASIRRTRYEPVVGAALLALESAGRMVEEPMYRMLDDTLPGQLKLQDLVSEANRGDHFGQ
jgi:N-acetylglucosamine kinase-like BadF-type ATPase